MSIIDKARNAISKRKQEAEAEAAAEQRARDWRAKDAQSRAEAFLESLGLPKTLKASIDGGTITICYKRKPVVEIYFGWDTRSEYEGGDYACESAPFQACWIKYHATWKPDGAQEYKRRHNSRRDTFYPNNDESQEELGEYLLRVMKNEFESPDE
jgi:hypothetical protein